MAQAQSSASTVRVSGEVMACELGDGLALLHHATGNFFILDEVGTFIWRRLSEPATVAEVAIDVSSEFDAGSAKVERDIGVFVQDMIDARLLVAA